MSGLFILKLAAVVIACASAVWGLLKKSSYDDENGHKRLTRAGQVAVLLAMGSALVAAGTQGLELVDRNTQRLNDTIRRNTEARAQYERDLLARTEAAEIKAGNAAELTATLAAESAARARHYALADKVSQGTAANLARTQASLRELNRLLNPIQTIRVTVELSIPVDSVDSPALARLDALLAERQRELNGARVTPIWRREHRLPGMIVDDPSAEVTLQRTSDYFPKKDDSLLQALAPAFVNITLTRNGTKTAEILADSIGSELVLGGDIDVQLEIAEADVELSYLPRKRKVVLKATRVWKPEEQERSSALQAIPDLVDANLVVWVNGDTSSRFTPRPPMLAALDSIWLECDGRYWALETHRIRTQRGRWIYFTVDRLGPPQTSETSLTQSWGAIGKR